MPPKNPILLLINFYQGRQPLMQFPIPSSRKAFKMVGTQTIPAVYDQISPTKSNPTNEQLPSPNSTFTYYVHKPQTSSKEYYALKVANIFHTPKFSLSHRPFPLLRA
ncbi:hypothetical protein V8G54_001845 [Vigna mungo]|uniref:Uncharacterized protein n=1 Tax=Vigna mungo TaxID=3915 RepID=A0AAQ3P922_VIGMU